MTGPVMGCYLHNGGSVEHSFMRSLMGLMRHTGLLYDDEMYAHRTSTGDLAGGRNALTAFFLERTSAEWMWMVDTDMGFQPDALDRLVASGQEMGGGIVGGRCVSPRYDDGDGMGGYTLGTVTTTYEWDGLGYRPMVFDYEDTRRVPVHGTGAAFLLVHRSAAQELHETSRHEPWRPRRDGRGEWLGEDLSFCLRAGERGIPMAVDLSVRTSHAKRVWML